MSERVQTPMTNEHFAAFCLSMVGQPVLVRHLRATRSRVNHCSARDRTRHSVDGSLPPLA